MRLRTKIASGLVAAAAVATGAFTLIPQASADPGPLCSGSQIIICVSTIKTNSGDKVLGLASVKDRDGSPNYWVDVTDIRVQRYYNGSWVNLKGSYSSDYGWKDVKDTAESANWVNCNAASHRTKVRVTWKRNGTNYAAWKYGPRIRC